MYIEPSYNSTASQNNDMSTQLPVIIVGAGVSGLALAQACQKKNIPFRIFERDGPTSLSQQRADEKGLTECWPLNVLKDALPDELVMRLSECHASRGDASLGEEDHYDVFNLETAEPKREKSTRVRLSQEKFRKLLLTGIEVQCSKTLTEIRVVKDSVKAIFSDGTSETGSILIGCDGGDSTVRRIMHPQGHQESEGSEHRHLLATASYPASEVSAIRNLHPFFLRCTQPGTEISLLITCSENTSEDNQADDTTKCQLLLQWPYRPNWLGRIDPTDCPNTRIGRMSLLKHLSESWAEPFRTFIQNMPRDTDIHPVEFSNGHTGYPPSLGARVTLAGRAASLAPRLDEGAESSSRSVRGLLETLEQMYAAGGGFDWEAYEDTLREEAGLEP